MWPRGRQVAGDPNVHFGGFGAGGIENVDSAKLLIDESVGPRGKRFEIEALVRNDLLYSFGLRVVSEERHRPVAVGKKIDRVAKPNRILIIRILAGHFFEGKVAQPHDIDRRGLPAAIAFPRSLPNLVG